MRLVSFTHNGRISWGSVHEAEVRDLGGLDAVAGRSLGAVLRDGDLSAAIAASPEAPMLAISDARLLPPITDPQKILCVGLNYADHIREMGRPWPERPVVFTRFPDTLVGDGEPLVAPRNSSSFDYEGEFAVVIGRTARHVRASEALDHVLGYSIMNDGSIRDYQRHTHQFTPGKNFPRSGSLGPMIVTADEFGNVGPQRIRTRVNGETVQDSTLDQLVFGVPELIAYCSEWTTLHPGDIIATGTPGGVGDGREPTLWLTPGDVVDITVDGLGSLTNPVTEEH